MGSHESAERRKGAPFWTLRATKNARPDPYSHFPDSLLTAFSEVYALGSVLYCIPYTSQTTTAATISTAAVTRPTFFQVESILNHSRQRPSRRATLA